MRAEETGELAAELVQRTVLGQRCAAQPVVLHADNGAPMKSYSLNAKLEALGIIASHCRPRVSNDNPFWESLFRTLNTGQNGPAGAATIVLARQCVTRFIDWYCNEHRHSGFRFVTLAERHQGQDQHLLQRRHTVYQPARLAYPTRWSGATRNWSSINRVQLNQDRMLPMERPEKLIAA